uniref:Uncharacterized protein n=1 Tax=Panagrolaimus sp. JU765 TaxID=591449 RepID=A0AC34QT57_9BILA
MGDLGQKREELMIEDDHDPGIVEDKNAVVDDLANLDVNGNAEVVQNTPVALSIDLYSEILYNVGKSHLLLANANAKFERATTWTFEKGRMYDMVKFAMTGKEPFNAFVRLFTQVSRLQISHDIDFSFDTRFGFFTATYSEQSGYENLFVSMLQIAIPQVKRVDFCKDYDARFYRLLFDVLSLNPKQKMIKFRRLPKVTEDAKIAFGKLIDKGILINFRDISDDVLKDLPPYRFESLNPVCFQYLISIGAKCTFRKLKVVGFYYSDRYPVDFVIDYVEEVHIKQSDDMNLPSFFTVLRRLFPKAEKIVIKYLSSHCTNTEITKMKREIIEAAQKSVQIIVKNYHRHKNLHVVRAHGFLPSKDGKTFEWKSEDNENKGIILKL